MVELCQIAPLENALGTVKSVVLLSRNIVWGFQRGISGALWASCDVS